MVEINAIDYEDKHVLHNLMQLYRYDSSEFDGHELSIHGLYLYKYIDHQWTDTYRRPLMIKVNGEIAGFALLMLDVPREFVHVSEASRTNIISDFLLCASIETKDMENEQPSTSLINSRERGRFGKRSPTSLPINFGIVLLRAIRKECIGDNPE